MFAVTANVQKAKDFGISQENIFTFWDWVGGRYSVWSAVGLPIELMLGTLQFQEFLSGANAMDEHFRTSQFAVNLPVLMALIGIWNINFLDYRTLLIMPYLDSLSKFPAYLQQLEMESNGKRAVNYGNYADYMTAPIIWGGVGCNGQHAYMQLLHQGTEVVPVDFIMAVNSFSGLQEQQDFLLASCLSQSRALMTGAAEQDLLSTNSISMAQAKMCPGNRPSSTICFDKLTPRILGGLIALYEHKVFVQGAIWQIQSFDQWGVELGKKITRNILPMLQQQESAKNVDGSTVGLLEYIRKNKRG
jgi:glucose-6-phosphate isomerase